MQTFELGKFISSLVSAHQQHAARKGIQLRMADDLASDVHIAGNRKKTGRIVDTVLQSTIDNAGATQIHFSIRQLVCSASDILLEFLLEDNARSPRPMAYYRAMVQAKHLIEELNGRSLLTINPGHNSLKFIIQCRWKAHHPDPSGAATRHTLADKQVLVVEDNEMNQRVISQLLHSYGMACTVADNGREAIDYLERHDHFDLVLLDMNMPRMDGHETAQYIRKQLKITLPIIGMCTGNDPSQSPAPNMNRMIRKPFTADELVGHLESLFDKATLVVTGIEGKALRASV